MFTGLTFSQGSRELILSEASPSFPAVRSELENNIQRSLELARCPFRNLIAGTLAILWWDCDSGGLPQVGKWTAYLFFQ